jgi:hypothetical protein
MRTLPIVLIAAKSMMSAALDVSTLTVAPATFLCELDMTQLRGEVRRLSWSPDGRRLAFLQKSGRKRYRLMIAAVGRATI